MSRHRIEALDAKHEVWVGWDRPLQTYFCQVYDTKLPEDENPILWLGADRPRQVREPDGLVRALKPYAELSPAIIRTLFADQEQGR
jgi:hypothetical protein